MKGGSTIVNVGPVSALPTATQSASLEKPKPATKASKKANKQAKQQKQPTEKSKGAKGSPAQPMGEKPTTPVAKKVTATSASPTGAEAQGKATKKPSPKQQNFKLMRDKERKEKQLKNTLGLAREDSTSSDSSTSKNHVDLVPSTSDTTQFPRLHDLEQDGVKSRNRRLFLAPSSRHANKESLGPCWGRESVARAPSTNTVAEQLHDEILDYVSYTRATVDAMTVHIEQMITSVRTCVHTLWPKSRVEPFGSYSTGIWLPSSDVDLVILDVVEINDRMLTVSNLRQLARALESQRWVESITLLDTAKIPVLKLVTVESSVPIDITFESTATHSGLLARDLIKRYADEMPALYPLAIVFKQLLRERDLNDAYTGGLSSYSIVLMIIHFELLWRYGEKCFRAASIFASGSPLPRPAEIIEEDARERAKQAAATKSLPSSPVKKPTDTTTTPPAITSSFAAVVSSRPKSLKRPVSEAGKSASTATPAQPFSYAAVAAGIAKVTETAPKPAAPVSYAAAVATTASSPSKTTTTVTSRVHTKLATVDAALDAISVTSSNADTEDASSCTSASSLSSSCPEDAHHIATDCHTERISLDSDADIEDVAVCLGEHTLGLLEFYGILFDYHKNGLSVRDGGYVYRLAEHVGPSGDLGKKLPSLVIEDPIHPDRNVSASSFAFTKVVAVFEDSFYALKYFRPSRFTPSTLSCLLSTSGHTSHHHQVATPTKVK